MGILSDRQIRKEIKITPFKDYGPKMPGTISSGLGSYGYDVRLGYKFKLFSPIGAKEIDPKNFDPKCLVEVDLTPAHDMRYTGKDDTDGYCHYCGDSGRTLMPDKCPSRDQPDHLLIPPHSFVLAESLEHFDIPRDVLCVVVGKSTYARCGLIVNVTPGEPEWPGVWTIEISNTTPLPVRVYPGEGIMQCLFFRSDERDAGMVQGVSDFANRVSASTGGIASSHLYDLMRLVQDKTKVSCERSYADKVGKYMHQTGLTLPKAENADTGETPRNRES